MSEIWKWTMDKKKKIHIDPPKMSEDIVNLISEGLQKKT